MRLRLPLFSKIFLGFWLASVAVLASWLLSNQYFDENPDRTAVEHRPQMPPQRFVLRTIYELQNVEAAALPDLVARASNEHEVDIYLLDRAGSDLLGRKVPLEAKELAQKLRGARRRAFLNRGKEHLLAHEIYRPEHGIVRAVLIFRPSNHLLLGVLGSYLWLRLGLAISISGLVCYLLSRLMTRRLNELQLASRRLATGDLNTRLQVRSQGGDETDELARDFNSMAAQLQERSQAQRRLLADVSHELRSPLARLRIALALAQENPVKAAGYLVRIERETERLEGLIGQLLASQSEHMEFDTHVDVAALLQELCSDANFEGAATDKRIDFYNETAHAMVASSGDLLHKGLENILRNALIHSAVKSVITVRLEEIGQDLQISVTNCGTGVPEDELDKIFEAFYRTDTARSRDTGGHGLGLAIARRVILRHCGRIWAQNTGTGLTVFVRLPRDQESHPGD